MTSDVMKRLSSIEPLPRGERLARRYEALGTSRRKMCWISVTTLGKMRLWLKMLDRADCRDHLAHWSPEVVRTYALPLRRCREERLDFMRQRSALLDREFNLTKDLARLGSTHLRLQHLVNDARQSVEAVLSSLSRDGRATPEVESHLRGLLDLLPPQATTPWTAATNVTAR